MGSRRYRGALIGVLTTLTLTAPACSGQEEVAGEGAAPNAISGMRGTTPLVNISKEFEQRMLTVDSTLITFDYGPEAYDAVIVTALAAEEARSDGAAMADRITDITRGGEKCTDYAGCLDLIRAGVDIDYDGASGPLEFSGNGEPTRASFGILEFGDNGCDRTKECIDNTRTMFVTATAPSSADVPQQRTTATRAGDGEFVVGSLLPETGSLDSLGPPTFAGVDLAIEEMNEAGGVLGRNARHVQGDSGDAKGGIATRTVDTLIGQDVDVIVGAAASSVSLEVIDRIVAAGVVMFSPANTSKVFSTYDDDALYFRSAPSDILQGQVLSDTIISDGHSIVYLMARNDGYGTGLIDDASNALTSGGATIVGESVYDPKATDFSAIVSDAKGADPDAIVVIGFEDDTSRILTEMIQAGIGPATVAVYGVDGNMTDTLAEDLEAGT